MKLRRGREKDNAGYLVIRMSVIIGARGGVNGAVPPGTALIERVVPSSHGAQDLSDAPLGRQFLRPLFPEHTCPVLRAAGTVPEVSPAAA